jgi:hypothetical protein
MQAGSFTREHRCKLDDGHSADWLRRRRNEKPELLLSTKDKTATRNLEIGNSGAVLMLNEIFKRPEIAAQKYRY